MRNPRFCQSSFFIKRQIEIRHTSRIHSPCSGFAFWRRPQICHGMRPRSRSDTMQHCCVWQRTYQAVPPYKLPQKRQHFMHPNQVITVATHSFARLKMKAAPVLHRISERTPRPMQPFVMVRTHEFTIRGIYPTGVSKCVRHITDKRIVPFNALRIQHLLQHVFRAHVVERKFLVVRIPSVGLIVVAVLDPAQQCIHQYRKRCRFALWISAI